MRQNVTDAIKNAAEKIDYAFGTGFEYRINPSVTRFPALWMAPPKLTDVKGRTESTAHYKIKLYLMAAGAASTPEQKDAIWNSLEQDAVKLVREIQNNGRIVGLSGLECAPGEFSLTNHGELSMEVSFSIGITNCSCEI